MQIGMQSSCLTKLEMIQFTSKLSGVGEMQEILSAPDSGKGGGGVRVPVAERTPTRASQRSSGWSDAQA